MDFSQSAHVLEVFLRHVLPDDMIVLAPPVPAEMVVAIGQAIRHLPQVDPFSMHNRMKTLYSWMDVAKRTEVVYDHALSSEDDDLLLRLSRYGHCSTGWLKI